jgi:CRISPR-associated protein Csm1
MPEAPTIYEVAVAGLLHDIGKLMQRADVPLSPESKRMEQLSDTYRHAHYTHDFFQEHFAPYLPADLNLIRVEHLAASHHDNGCEHYARLIQLADRASAAFDRPETSETGTGWKCQRLLAPFADHLTAPPRNSFVSLVPLAFDGVASFPQPEDKPADRTAEYMALWTEFLAALPALQAGARNLDIWLGTLTTILERFTWAVPSYTQSKHADISLFDHALSTAGIASALFAYHDANNIWDDQALSDSTSKRLRIITADLSGIQNFIQSVPVKHRKEFQQHLRARSFVIGMITDVLLFKLLRELGLPRVCIWLRHGGKFTVLAPNLPAVAAAVERIQQEVDAWTLDTFYGEVRVHLDAATTLALEDFKRDNFAALLSQVSAQLQQRKKRPLAAHLRPKDAWDPARFVIKAEADADAAFEESDALPYARIAQDLLTAPLVINYLPPQAQASLNLFGVTIGLAKEPAADALYCECVNPASAGLPGIVMANHVYKENGKIVSFQRLAGTSSDNEHAMVLLLKGDVDGLGAVFSADTAGGLSLSRYLFRSRMLHYFFAGHLQHVLASKYQRSYTVYAGGDDFLLIVPPESGLCLAAQLRSDFHRWTSGALTFSAAAAPYKTNTPLRNGFRLAEDWLNDNAKRVAEKKRLCAYHTIVTWDLANHLAGLETLLRQYYDQNHINMAFLQRLLQYHNMHRMATSGDKRDLSGFLYDARMRYDIARNVAKNAPRDQRAAIRDSLVNALRGAGTIAPDTIMSALRIPVSSLIYQKRRIR